MMMMGRLMMIRGMRVRMAVLRDNESDGDDDGVCVSICLWVLFFLTA